MTDTKHLIDVKALRRAMECLWRDAPDHAHYHLCMKNIVDLIDSAPRLEVVGEGWARWHKEGRLDSVSLVEPPSYVRQSPVLIVRKPEESEPVHTSTQDDPGSRTIEPKREPWSDEVLRLSERVAALEHFQTIAEDRLDEIEDRAATLRRRPRRGEASP